MDLDEIKEGLSLPGKSRVGLAAAMGVDVSQISRLLNGKRQLKVNEVAMIRTYLYGDAKSLLNDRQSAAETTGKAQPLAKLNEVRELLDQAETLGLDAVTIILTALRDAVSAKKGESWREENKDAIEEYNKRVASRGAFGDNARNF